MTTIEELLATRDAAGKHFVSVAEEFCKALVDLGGIDGALAAVWNDARSRDLRTFFHIPPTLEQGRYMHPEFGPIQRVDMNDRIAPRRDEIVAKFFNRGK